MIENWRIALYPIGYLANFFFAGRFCIQWLQSELKQRSLVTKSFWYISLVGNFLLILHSLIQVQYQVCLVQTCNAVISWRNLNLLAPTSQQVKLRTVFFLFGIGIALATAAFIAQGYLFFDGNVEWFRVPATGWNDNLLKISVSPFWHFLGTIGVVLFALRFWVQWWGAETHGESVLNESFWWLSLTGASLSLLYFASFGDIVNIIGPGLGIIPYIRNLMLLKKKNSPLKSPS